MHVYADVDKIKGPSMCRLCLQDVESEEFCVVVL